MRAGSLFVATRWLVYVLVSDDTRRTYVGTTTDLPRRLAQHNGELPGGAKATRTGRPWSVGVYYPGFEDRGAAQKFEAAVKSRRGADRLAVRAPTGMRRRRPRSRR